MDDGMTNQEEGKEQEEEEEEEEEKVHFAGISIRIHNERRMRPGIHKS